jgi:hypothetical protein
MPALAKWVNSDLRVTSGLSKGFTVPQVARKRAWTEPMVWSQALKGKSDIGRFKELNLGSKPGIYGISWNVTNDSEMNGPDVSLHNWRHIFSIFFLNKTIWFWTPWQGEVCADTCLAFINSDWRDFQNCPANKENPHQAILIVDYHEILKKKGWMLTHIIQAPMSSERFNAGVVAAMQQKRSLALSGDM